MRPNGRAWLKAQNPFLERKRSRKEKVRKFAKAMQLTCSRKGARVQIPLPALKLLWKRSLIKKQNKKKDEGQGRNLGFALGRWSSGMTLPLHPFGNRKKFWIKPFPKRVARQKSQVRSLPGPSDLFRKKV